MRRSVLLLLGALVLAPAPALAARTVAIRPAPAPGGALAVSPTGAWLALSRPLGARVRVVLVRRDGTGERRIVGSWAPGPRVAVEDDGSARVEGLRTSDRFARLYHVAPGAVAPVAYTGILPEEVLGTVPGSDAVVAHVEHRVVFVLADGVLRQVGRRHGRRDGRSVAIARDGSVLAVIGTTPAAGGGGSRVPSVWIAGGDGTAPERTDFRVPLRSLRFSADLARAVGVAGDGRAIVRFERRGRRLVRVGRTTAASVITSAAIAGDGSTIATVRGPVRRIHAGPWQGPLRTRSAWRSGPTEALAFALTDDGRYAARVLAGDGGRFLRLDADAGPVPGCAALAVSVLDHGGAFGCDSTAAAACADAARAVLTVAFPDGAVALRVAGRIAVTGSARFATGGRSVLFEARPCAGGAASTYLASIGPPA